ncbi:MAG: glycine cleavage system protein GcvH [Syntrophomonadaceae bacterium]
MDIPENLLYTQDHEWISVEGNNGKIGITDYAQTHLGDIVYIELPATDSEVAQGESIGVIESVKAVANVFSPASGTIIEVNEELEDSPELLNTDPYENWIAIIELTELSELDNLMTAEAYATYCHNLEENEG